MKKEKQGLSICINEEGGLQLYGTTHHQEVVELLSSDPKYLLSVFTQLGVAIKKQLDGDASDYFKGYKEESTEAAKDIKLQEQFLENLTKPVTPKPVIGDQNITWE